MEDVAVGGKGVCRTDESQLAEQLAPLSGRRRLCRRRFFRSGGFDDPIDESGGECLLRREPAAGAVVFGHQEGELLRSAARTGGIDLRQACVGFAEQVDAGRKLFGIAFGGADRIVDQVEGVGRYFAASLRCGLCDDCGRRSRIAVAAGDDVSVERREGLVDQQGVVYVAARRADIDDDFRGVDFAQPVEAVPEFFVGGYARRGLVELPLLGDADHPFDVHEAGVVAVGDLNVGLHGKLFFAGSLAGVRNGVGCEWGRCGFAASPLRQEGWADFRGVHPVRVRGVVRLRSARMKDGRRAIRWADG